MGWILSETVSDDRPSWRRFSRRGRFLISTGQAALETDDAGVLQRVLDAAGGDHREYGVLMRRLRAAQDELGPGAAVSFPDGDRFASVEIALSHLGG
ncbi:hypothetical protein GCM10009638_13420 [Luteococcus sanguinis]